MFYFYFFYCLFVSPRATAGRATCCPQNGGRGLRPPGRGGDLAPLVPTVPPRPGRGAAAGLRCRPRVPLLSQRRRGSTANTALPSAAPAQLGRRRPPQSCCVTRLGNQAGRARSAFPTTWRGGCCFRGPEGPRGPGAPAWDAHRPSVLRLGRAHGGHPQGIWGGSLSWPFCPGQHVGPPPQFPSRTKGVRKWETAFGGTF